MRVRKRLDGGGAVGENLKERKEKAVCGRVDGRRRRLDAEEMRL